MCIIISKNKNIDTLPKRASLENAFNYNPDGAGMMYVDNGHVVIDKGYMTLESFLQRYDELCAKYNNFKNKALVFHFRIGTSSGNTPENTHPYPVTTKVENLHALKFNCDLGVAHNGIIHDYTPKDKNSKTNDTQNFILTYLAPIYKHFKNFYKMDTMRAGINSITNSKFVFLDNHERTYYVGDFINDDGVLYSNNSYTIQLPKYDARFDWYDDDYYNDEDAKERIFEYYDINNGLIYLNMNDMYFDESTASYREIGDVVDYNAFDMVYSLYTKNLYLLDYTTDTLTTYAENVRVCDNAFNFIE